MGKLILYIASSLDGYIARPDGSIDWLTSLPNPSSEDYGYTELLARISTIVMGRKTYDDIIGFDMEWPYSGLTTFVVSSDKSWMPRSPESYLLQGEVKQALQKLKSDAEKDVWLVGGATLITAALRHKLLDTMIIAVIPTIIGAGIPLFSGDTGESKWALTEVKSFDTGVVNLTYQKTD